MWEILQGDVRSRLADLSPEMFQCVVTSPPYWGLRDYKLEPLVWDGQEACNHEWGNEQLARGPAQAQGSSSQRKGRSNIGEQIHRGVSQGCWCQSCGAWRGSLGLEPTPELYVQHLVEIFREVRRVLRVDGTLWLNLGDSYASQGGGARGGYDGGILASPGHKNEAGTRCRSRVAGVSGLKLKDLVGIPWRVAFALQADGWWLRSDIIWHKLNPMPESITDRPTKAHEYVFLLAKSEKYYYDWRSILEPFADSRQGRDGGTAPSQRNRGGHTDGLTKPSGIDPSSNGGRNRRSVWTISSQPFKGAHFATFPPKLIEPCILAGSHPDDLILDPFSGAGTTMLVAEQLGRNSVGIELNPQYCTLATQRLHNAGL